MSTTQEIQEQFEVFSDYLRKNRLKMTRQRRRVVDSFLQMDGHVSTEELYELVRKQNPSLGLTTVFRTLKALTDCGLARKTVLNDGRTRFEPIYKRPYHHHILCVECDNTIEFFSPDWERIQKEIVSQYGFKTLRHSIKIFGVCKSCQNESKTPYEVFDSDLVFTRDALQIAMETEKRGVDFYSTALKTVKNPSTKQTFLKMLDDERAHLNEIEEQWSQLLERDNSILEAPVFLHFDYETLKQIFPSKEEVKRKLKSNLSALEALELAMTMEQDAHNFFKQYAQRFNDTRGRDIFSRFADEEQEHYEVIKQEYDRLATDLTTS